MKLLFCKKCQDIFKLQKEIRSCFCGDTKGRYLDNLNAEYSGKYAIPLRFANSTLVAAIRVYDDNWQIHKEHGIEFKAFIIPKKCDTFKRK